MAAARNTGNELWEACTVGDLEAVQRLVKDPQVDVNWRDPTLGRTCFFRACGHGRTSVVKFLLETYPDTLDITQVSNERCSPFSIAAQGGFSEIVRMLLCDPRTDVKMSAHNGATPFNLACEDGWESVVEMLMDDGRIDINEPDIRRRTPLWMASQGGQLPVVRFILARADFVNTAMKSGPGERP